MKAIIDLDFVLHAAACVGEERYVEVTHTSTGRVKEFSNKTEFHGRNKQGGWLSELNKKRVEDDKEVFPVEAFEVTHKQRVTEPLANVLHSAKSMVETALRSSGATSYEAYVGVKAGTCFRVGLSNMLEYKGNRKDLLSPLLKEDVRQYLLKKFDATEVDTLEVDDSVVIRCKELLDKGEDAFVLAIDKDAMGCPIKVYNPNRPEEGVVDCRGFGELRLDNNKVRGKGRLFKYWQVSVGDTTDNYKANALSKVKWGDKSAYKSLVECKSDKESWEVLVETYKTLYPTPVTFTSWKGETITMDWLDCLSEIYLMAHMKESYTDSSDVKDILDKLGVVY